ncbi:MAG: A/G-specific adenine glycosylase [Bacteroidetes bacterium]|nr:MAG: A/G-specific adenine glycosylase [Bacteroidota bacterium]MBZ0195531.1 A/G-specific adenine glycosylase [Candidatus Kapabacteria bacterium]
MISTKNTTRIRALALAWYRKSGRDFPWRAANASVYTVFVSEFMLQQTQATRVASLLPIFLRRFPGIRELAGATNAKVIRAWQGLGYNGRALRLRDAAAIIARDYRSEIPDDAGVLRTLPGIGDYTSNAIACFGYGKRTVVIDVNIRRVYSRLLQPMPHCGVLATNSQVSKFAESIIPRQNPEEWHQAVMDLGATVCMAKKTLCSLCPLSSVCPSYGLPKAPAPIRKSAEPEIQGVPRRIWRGRIVQLLRESPDRGLSLTALLPKGALDSDDREVWLNLLYRMQADGLIRIGKMIELQS